MNERLQLGRAPYRDFTYPRSLTESAGGAWPTGPRRSGWRSSRSIPSWRGGTRGARGGEAGDHDPRPRGRGSPTAGGSAGGGGVRGHEGQGRRAVQRFTVTGIRTEVAAAAFEAEGGRVLEASRHRNKLRLGTWRATVSGSCSRARRRKAPGQDWRGSPQQGVPNYYGPQRFGARGDNAAAGLAVLQGRRRVGRWQRDLLVSALQSLVFNEVLARRVEGETGTALSRATCCGKRTRGTLPVRGPEVDGLRRRPRGQPHGPLPGRKAPEPPGKRPKVEAAVLRDLGPRAGPLRRGDGEPSAPPRAPGPLGPGGRGGGAGLDHVSLPARLRHSLRRGDGSAAPRGRRLPSGAAGPLSAPAGCDHLLTLEQILALGGSEERARCRKRSNAFHPGDLRRGVPWTPSLRLRRSLVSPWPAGGRGSTSRSRPKPVLHVVGV